MAIGLATTDRLELKDFLGIYSELAETLLSTWHTLLSETQNAIWETLPLEIQHTLTHELSKQAAEFQYNPPVSRIPKNIEDMNLNQILRTVAEKRIQQYPSLREAAESLSIDIRTLRRYAQWKESND